MSVKAINSLQEFKDLLASNKAFVIDFWAPWCGPCRAISPLYEKWAEKDEYTNIDFYKVNLDENEELGMELDIRAMPAFILFSNGAKVDECLGADPKALQGLLQRGATLS